VKALIETRVAIAWLLLAAIVSRAAVIIWKIAVIDAPPSGALFIQSAQEPEGPSATITPFAASFLPSATPPDESSVDDAGILNAAGQDTPNAPPPTPTTLIISVYISGAVVKPGVYTLPDGARVESAVAAAGGALPDADLDEINLAERLSDEAHIIVYHKGEAPTVNEGAVSGQGRSASPVSTGTPRAGRSQTPQTSRQPTTVGANVPAAKPTPSVKININTATAVELEQIPGIGPSLAQRIVADRERNGAYKTVEELTRISGIKEGVLAKLRNYVTVGP
jgi:competence protein ComEA